MKSLAAAICVCLFTLLLPSPATAAERPNILWISCEDISPHLGCYGDPNATTPNLDALAQEGVRYTGAFTCHGVCAPSRTGIITSMYPIALGANHMRSKAELPDHVRCFPVWLREAGYYCTNNSKTDYNFNWNQAEVWDESSNRAHYRNRGDGQPFFAVFNLTMTHESKIWPEGWQGVVKDLPPNERHDPDRLTVPPLYPDTPEVRAAHARLLDIITVMDRRAGELLQELDQAGLTEDTIVIYWSDHGNGFPRAKRWIYDSGTRVPMIVRIPETFRVDGQGTPGSVDDTLINLIDLGPTVLNLAGVSIPKHMAGQPFLGSNLPTSREYIYGARDRVDERLDLVRSVRDRRFRYVRNLMPWKPALQHIGYSERSVVRREMRRLEAEGTLAPHSAQFLRAPRAPEELYDLNADPWELHNLAAEPDFQEHLVRLRAECDRWQLTSRDAHLIPEALLDSEAAAAGSRWGLLNGDGGEERAATLLQTAKAASQMDDASARLLRSRTEHPDPAVRWWAIVGLDRGPAAADSAMIFLEAMKDPSPVVAVAAAAAVARHGDFRQGCEALAARLNSDGPFVSYAAILELDELGPDAVRIAETQIRAMAKEEYAGRLAEHALGQLAN